MSVQFRINQSGGRYIGQSQYLIAQEIWTSRHFVQNVLCDYNLTNSCYQQPKRHGCSILTPNAIECIEILQTLQTEYLYCWDLKKTCYEWYTPTPITKFLGNKLMMTKQKIHSLIQIKEWRYWKTCKTFPWSSQWLRSQFTSLLWRDRHNKNHKFYR